MMRFGVAVALWCLAQGSASIPGARDDVPPPTAYDALTASAPLGLGTETQALAWAGLRVAAGLVATLALIYASAKLVLPRLARRWPGRARGAIAVVERLPLDGHNAVILLATAGGRQMLLGTGEHGVQFLTHLAEDAPADTFNASMVRAHRSAPNGVGEHADESAH